MFAVTNLRAPKSLTPPPKKNNENISNILYELLYGLVITYHIILTYLEIKSYS